jgi:CheY-like chemotaxis protein
MLAVSDTGFGMDKATQDRIFEPFFTTKETGKGTGLGLATVFGIVQQSGGSIWVYSEPGGGTTFKVFFPIPSHVEVVKPSLAPEALTNLRGTETILLVEDDAKVRAVARAILRKGGYDVVEASSGDDALRLSAAHANEIDLLVTDVIMPHMSGRELSERLAGLRPAMKILFMSGYTDDAVVRHGIFESTIDFIQKPLTPDALSRKVREVLDAPKRAVA